MTNTPAVTQSIWGYIGDLPLNSLLACLFQLAQERAWGIIYRVHRVVASFPPVQTVHGSKMSYVFHSLCRFRRMNLDFPNICHLSPPGRWKAIAYLAEFQALSTQPLPFQSVLPIATSSLLNAWYAYVHVYLIPPSRSWNTVLEVLCNGSNSTNTTCYMFGGIIVLRCHVHDSKNSTASRKH